MMSLSSSIVCVIGCRWPRRSRCGGGLSVGSNKPGAERSAASAFALFSLAGVGGGACTARDFAVSKAESMSCFTSLNRLPACGLSGPATLPSPFWTLLIRPLLAPRKSTRARSTASASAALAKAAVASPANWSSSARNSAREDINQKFGLKQKVTKRTKSLAFLRCLRSFCSKCTSGTQHNVACRRIVVGGRRSQPQMKKERRATAASPLMLGVLVITTPPWLPSPFAPRRRRSQNPPGRESPSPRGSCD